MLPITPCVSSFNCVPSRKKIKIKENRKECNDVINKITHAKTQTNDVHIYAPRGTNQTKKMNFIRARGDGGRHCRAFIDVILYCSSDAFTRSNRRCRRVAESETYGNTGARVFRARFSGGITNVFYDLSKTYTACLALSPVEREELWKLNL